MCVCIYMPHQSYIFLILLKTKEPKLSPIVLSMYSSPPSYCYQPISLSPFFNLVVKSAIELQL